MIDLIALCLTASFLGVSPRPTRFLLASGVGALYASVYLFLPRSLPLFVILGAAVLLFMSLLCTGRVHFFRLLRFFVLFFVIETLLGGAVYYFYQRLDTVSGTLLSDFSEAPENRSFLLFSIVVLLSVGVLRLCGALLTGAEAERTVGVTLTYGGQSVVLEALVDTGNLLRDPLDSSPVLLIKAHAAASLFPSALLCEKYDALDISLRRRIRMIPLDTVGGGRLLSGVRMEDVSVRSGKREEKIFITVAIDKEEGSYGGYDALMPYAALKYVL